MSRTLKQRTREILRSEIHDETKCGKKIIGSQMQFSDKDSRRWFAIKDRLVCNNFYLFVINELRTVQGHADNTAWNIWRNIAT